MGGANPYRGFPLDNFSFYLRRQDSNLRPAAYETAELTGLLYTAIIGDGPNIGIRPLEEVMICQPAEPVCLSTGHDPGILCPIFSHILCVGSAGFYGGILRVLVKFQ